jgi:hypothetical protein
VTPARTDSKIPGKRIIECPCGRHDPADARSGERIASSKCYRRSCASGLGWRHRMAVAPMARQITRREVVWAVAERYRAAGRHEKGRSLDELTATTGWHRKHAVGALSTVAASRTGRLQQVRRRPARSTRGTATDRSAAQVRRVLAMHWLRCGKPQIACAASCPAYAQPITLG